MVPLPLCRAVIWGGEKGIHFRLFQICYLPFRCPLEGYNPDLAAPFDVFGTPLAYKARESPDTGKPLIARRC
jgi:hypothetical protein